MHAIDGRILLESLSEAPLETGGFSETCEIELTIQALLCEKPIVRSAVRKTTLSILRKRS